MSRCDTWSPGGRVPKQAARSSAVLPQVARPEAVWPRPEAAWPRSARPEAAWPRSARLGLAPVLALAKVLLVALRRAGVLKLVPASQAAWPRAWPARAPGARRARRTGTRPAAYRPAA